MNTWHEMTIEAVVEALRTSGQGLTSAEARDRLVRYGRNLLAEAKRRSPFRMFVAQFGDFMILVLLAAAVISGLIGETTDAAAIIAIVVLNAAIGFVQEYRAERAMAALKAMAAPNATVLRDGVPATIAASEVVPGDVVLLEAGAIVPADLRLDAAARLRVDESVLTGESAPAEKVADRLGPGDLPLGDRRNMAHKGTTVVFGRGRGFAVSTGMATEFGKIAALLQERGEVKTPLQRRLGGFGRRLSVAALAICGVVFMAGIMRGEEMLLMFLTAVSLAVAAIPEALPAVVTISLALGARKMVQKNALVRKLPAVEALGSVTYICSDKTGTLTMNRMRVEEFCCDGTVARGPGSSEIWHELMRAMALCNDAHEDVSGRVVGDPTEAALLAAAAQAGYEKRALEKQCPRLAEIPFDAERRCMTTLHSEVDGGVFSLTKGAFEVLIERSADMATSSSGRIGVPVGDLEKMCEAMASEGLRVLAFGTRRWPACPASLAARDVERDLTLLGFVGIMDPPRAEAREAVQMCKSAGIVPVMITGDHPGTARAIARRLDIVSDGDAIMTGDELASLSGKELEARVGSIRVYARVAPQQKLKIVEALQTRGEFVAMTGDGVNDAPALKHADIGVAMGIAGTDVAKEASSMILLDDNFATIVRAVREGRRIYDNMRRFIRYALATNSGEIWTIFLAPFFGLPIPLLPVQILWMNLVTDGLPGLSLASEPEERDVMQRPPRPPQEGVLAAGLGLHVIWVGLLMAALTIGTQAWSIRTGSANWQTMVFTVLCLSQLANVLAVRSERESLFAQGLLSNVPLLAAVIATVLLQIAVVYVPVLNPVFKTLPLAPGQLAAAFGIASLIFFAVEAEKWAKRRYRDKPAAVVATS
jgi:Ca2+-transporting ATPase